MKNSRPSFFIDAPCFLTRKRGVSHFSRNQSGKQFNKTNTLQGNFEAAVFFVTEKHSRFFCAQNQNERMDVP
jgi:hypothetical protein